MNDVQIKIAQLQVKGWTLAAIADELGVTSNAVEKWKAGHRRPHLEKPVLASLAHLAKRRNIPKRRRYDKIKGGHNA